MDDKTLNEVVQQAKAAHKARLDGLGIGLAAASEIERAYANSATRYGQKVLTQARRVREAIEELEDRIAAV